MRLLQLKPRNAVVRLALSPDGGRIAIGQLQHGVRVLDTVTGDELKHLLVPWKKHQARTLFSPSGRYSLSVGTWDVRFAETIANDFNFRFQGGWQWGWDRHIPPDDAVGFPLDAWGQNPSTSFSPQREWAVRLTNCALSADHRFAVGRVWHPRERAVVYDAVRATIVGRIANTPSGDPPLHAAFTAAGLAIADARGVAVYAVPPAVEPSPLETRPPASGPAADRRVIGRFFHGLFNKGPAPRKPSLVPPIQPPVLSPVATIMATQPQPDANIPPFAMLPCGRRMLIRGEKSRVELRDVASGEIITVWKWGLPRLLSLAVAGNGFLAAAGGVKGQVMLWDLE